MGELLRIQSKKKVDGIQRELSTLLITWEAIMIKTSETVNQAPGREKYPQSRELKVLETVMEAPSKARSVGLTYIPICLEPCIVLRGKWLSKAGFDIGQKVTVTVESNELYITSSSTIEDVSSEL